MTRYLAPALLMLVAVSCSDGPTESGNNSPTANFSYTPASPIAGQEIVFDGATSIDVDGTVESYQWTFSSTASDTGRIATHIFATSGTYPVTLRVVDNDGDSGTTTKQSSSSLVTS